MKKNKKIKAFTLIELLAVIVIMAVIALITTPVMLGVIDSANKKSYEESLRFLIKATDNYIVSNNFKDIPKEGISATDKNIKMQNKNFKGGLVYRNENKKLYVKTVTDGRYCGSGTLLDMEVVKGGCYLLDKSEASVNAIIGIITSKSIQIIVNANDEESGIKSYEYSIDEGKTYKKGEGNIYVFTNLKKNKEYKIKVKVTNGNDLVTIKDLTATTSDIDSPTYSVDKEGWQKQKIVTINYPTGSGLTYSYSLDKGLNWTNAEQGQKVTFNVNGEIIARVTDGTNTVSAVPLSVTLIDTLPPLCGWVEGASTVWTGANRTISVNCSDSGECSQGTFVQTFTTTATTSYITISDKAGNTVNCPVNVYVDKTPPTMTRVDLRNQNGATYVSGSVSAIPVTIYPFATDNVSVAKYVYAHTANPTTYIDMANPWTITWDGNWNFYVWAVDHVGNRSANYINFHLIISQRVTKYRTRSCSTVQEPHGCTGNYVSCGSPYNICNKDGHFYPPETCSPSFCKGSTLWCYVHPMYSKYVCSDWGVWTTSYCSPGDNCQTSQCRADSPYGACY